MNTNKPQNGAKKCPHCWSQTDCDCSYDLSVIRAEAINADVMERPHGEVETDWCDMEGY